MSSAASTMGEESEWRPALSAGNDYGHITRGMPVKNCLILTGNTAVGGQLSTLLGKCGWNIQVVHSDSQAYSSILNEKMDIVIADIDAVDLGGLAMMTFCHHHYPSITTYAIAPMEDAQRKKLAHELGGCKGFFYLANNGHSINLSRGMGATFMAGLPEGLPAIGSQARVPA